MDRRSFLGQLAAVSATARLLAQEIAHRTESPEFQFIRPKQGKHPFRLRTMDRRPDIVLITLDMVSPDHWRPARKLFQEMDLVALRTLAAESVVFTNCFTTSPLCAPARATIATGRYTYITANGERAHDGHETALRPDDVIFQEYLKATGYRTKHAGKGHLGTQKLIEAFDENIEAWDRWAPPVHDDEEYLSHLARLGVKGFRYRKEIYGLQQDRRTPWARWGGWLEQANGEPFPIEAQYTHYLVERAIRKLDAALQPEGPTRPPLYLQLDIFDPHQPFSIPAGLEDREKELRRVIRLHPSYERVRQNDWRRFPDEPKVYHFYRKNWGLYDGQTALDYMVANALQMEVVDRALRKLLSALKERRIYDEALIIFTVDHGEMNTRSALVDKGVYLYPEVLRVPLMIKPPASWAIKPHSVDAPVCHLDIAPTILEAAGIEPMARMDGRSLLPYIRGTTVAADRPFLMECGWHVAVNFACGIQRWDKTGHYLYVYNCSDEIDELYDLNDEEPQNLALQPQYGKLRRDMAEYLGAFLERDVRWIGYWHSFRIDHYFDLPRHVPGDVQMFRPV